MRSTAASGGSPVGQFLSVLADLRDQIGGPYYLGDVNGRLEWPDRGVYFFFSPASDLRQMPSTKWRLSRIGTVGVSTGSSNTLWNRLRQHRGNVRGKYAGGGNHRGSIFRLHVGRALIEKHGWHDEYPTEASRISTPRRLLFASRNTNSNSACRSTSGICRFCGLTFRASPDPSATEPRLSQTLSRWCRGIVDLQDRQTSIGLDITRRNLRCISLDCGTCDTSPTHLTPRSWTSYQSISRQRRRWIINRGSESDGGSY